MITGNYNSLVGRRVLVTTQSWFYGPDARQYRAAYGVLKAIVEAKDVFGFIPNRAHANWFVEVSGLIIMGCQVLYILDCPDTPPFKEQSCKVTEQGEVKTFEIDSTILNLI